MKKDVKKLVELQINGENIQIEKKKIKICICVFHQLTEKYGFPPLRGCL